VSSGQVESIDHRTLAREMVRAFVSGGKERPVLPHGRRGEIISLVVRAMIEPDLLDGYIRAIEEERRSQEAEEALLGLPCPDLPEERIAEGGFDSLADGELAAIAVDPAALRTLAAYLWGEFVPEGGTIERGDWWWEAVTRGETAHPGLARGFLEGLKRQEEQTARGRETLPFDDARHTSRSRRKILRLIGQVTALAASLLIGVFLGTSVLQDGGGGRTLGIGGEARYGPVRGTERERSVVFRSPIRGFATIVVLREGSPPEVLPGPGQDDLRVRPGVDLEHGPLPPGTDVALVLITETPASDPIRRALRGASFSPGEAGVLRAELEAALRGMNYRRLALGTIRFEPPPE
jgi:hypothetical protein